MHLGYTKTVQIEIVGNFFGDNGVGITTMLIQSKFLNISKNIFKRNSQNAIVVESSSEIVLQLSENQFIDNTGTAIVNLDIRGSPWKVVLEMIKNQFINNTGTATIINLNTQRSSSEIVLQLSENQFIDNTGTAIVNLDIRGSPWKVVLEMIKNQFINNAGTATIVNLNTQRSSSEIVLQLSENQFIDNTGTAIVNLDIRGSPWKVVLEMIKNQFINNAGTATIVNLNTQRSSSEIVLQLSENQFIDNTGTAIVNLDIRGSPWKVVLEMIKNQFINNTGMAIVNLDSPRSSSVIVLQMRQNQFINNTGTTIVNLNTQGYTDVMTIFKNTWKHNFGHAMIRFNIPKYSKASNFFDNELTQNVISQKYPLVTEYFVNEATILHINGNFQFKRNIFENPSAPYEFATQSCFHGDTIDARFNWWGTKDPNIISSKIYDFASQNDLDIVDFLPFMSSKHMESKAIFNKSRNVFANGSKIGGPLISDVVLTKTKSPYLVIKDIIVYPNATLKIEPGVQVNVLPYLGFLVYGKMNIVGKENSLIRFDVGYYGNREIKQSVRPLRLVNGTKGWEGRVQVYYNNIWGDICVDGWSNTDGDIICKQFGFQSYVGRINLGNQPISQIVWLKNIRCSASVHSDITSCPFEGWGVTCRYSAPLAIRCNPGYWRGIRFSDMAKSSEISYAKFERGGSYPSNGYNFVLQFDAQRQSVHDIEINDIGANGMNIIIPNQGFTFYNITIGNGQYQSDIGIQSRTLALSLYDSNIIGTSKYLRYGVSSGIYFGRNKNTELSDQRMSHVLAILPEITNGSILTKDICNYQGNETIISEDSFVALSIGVTSGSGDVNCEHVLRIKSTATVSVYSAQSFYSGDEVIISDRPHSLPNGTIYSMSSPFNYVFVFGPGVLYLRYLRRGGYSGVKTDIFILTTKSKLLFCLVNLKTISAFYLK